MSNIRVSDAALVSAEVITVTSAAGATSVPVDMGEHRKALIVASAKTTSGAVVTIDLMESTAAITAGTSAAGGKAALTLGSSVNTSIPSSRGAQSVLLTMGSASTTNDKLTLSLGNKTRYFQYTTSTSLLSDTAIKSTLSYFGSTVGSTVNTGVALSLGKLGSVIRHPDNFGPAVEVSTPSTATLLVSVGGGQKGSLGLATTYSTAFIVGTVQRAVGAYNVDAGELSTGGKRYVSIKVTSAATSVNVAVANVLMGSRDKGAPFPGNLSTVDFAT